MPKEFEEEPIEQPQPRPEVPPLSRRGRQSIQGVSPAPEAAADDAALPDAKVPANDFIGLVSVIAHFDLFLSIIVHLVIQLTQIEGNHVRNIQRQP